METTKELNTNAYENNSKYNRHTGQGVKNIQKSRSYKDDHSRKWRKRNKKHFVKEDRLNNKKISAKQDVKINDKLTKPKRNWNLF